MAETYTVKRGDTLSEIAQTYLGDASKYKQLAAINNIQNPDLIYVGQVLKLSNDGGTSGETTSDEKTVTITQFGLQSDIDNVLFVTWTWGKYLTTLEYEVRWDYYTNNHTWFGGTSSTTTTKDRFSTYNIPSNAKIVRVRIRPISAKKKEGGKEVTHWDAEWTSWKQYNVTVKPDVPPVPTITTNGLKLTVEVENVPSDPSIIQFEIIRDNNSTAYKSQKVTVQTAMASYTCDILAGSVYKVRARAYKDGTYSDWSNYSSNVNTIPSVPGSITKCEPTISDFILLEWSSVANADSYDIEYTTDQSKFDTSDQVTSKTGVTTTSFEVSSGIELGKEYFFRVRAVNSVGSSGWSEIKSTIIGKGPAAPTTWSSSNTVVVGEPLNLYWVHNSEDGSSQTYAHLQVYINGILTIEEDIENSKDENEKDKTSSYSIDTSKYAEGVKIEWRVRTAGISKKYGAWSIQRAIDVYAPPVLELTITDYDGYPFETLTQFPFYVEALAGPHTQAPIGYHLSITSDEIYETVDSVGNSKVVSEGEVIYSKYFDTSSNPLEVELSANDMCLENGVSYTLVCVVSMNSGLTAEASFNFDVSWSKTEYLPNAEIGIDNDTLTAYIKPYCASSKMVIYQVQQEYNNKYVVMTTKIDSVYGEIQNGIKTTTNDAVYYGVTADGDDVYYCYKEESLRTDNVTLSVYRREFDGSFTEIATALDGSKNTFVTDPHPALDYARYRIVSTSKENGSVYYYDPPAIPIGCKSIVIQWDEAWTEFDTQGSEDSLEQPPWSGSMLKLPYNVDVSQKNSSDVSLIKYAGREHPVAYYGTHLDESQSLSVSIQKSDIDTLYALRRLSRWRGNVYVREPSGTGYWANVRVTYSLKHLELIVPVSIEVTRVEGGA